MCQALHIYYLPLRQVSDKDKTKPKPKNAMGLNLLQQLNSLNSPSAILGHPLFWSYYSKDCSCKFLGCCNFPQKTIESLDRSRPENGNAVYLRLHEYWLHLIHTIKSLGISKSTWAEYPILYNKTLPIKPINYPSSSCKDCLDFPHHFPLQLMNYPLNKDHGSWAIWPVPTSPSQCVLIPTLSFLFQ
jgi:hypothetical protein